MIPGIDDSETFGVCWLDADSKVVFQNEKSKDICGEKDHKICHTCLDHIGFHARTTGILNGKKIKINETLCDIVCLKDHKKISVVLHPNKAVEKYQAHLENCGLTAREKEIALFVLEGKNNQSILEALCISKSTLKTHLNVLYRKASWLKSFRHTV